MVLNRSNILALAAMACAIFAILPAHAQDLTASGRGWIDTATGPNGNTSNNNYIAGKGNSGDLFRDHFDFSIPTLSGTLLTATLEIVQPPASVFSGHFGPATTYSVYSLGAFGSYAFADIGTGTLYGSVPLDVSSDGTTVSVSLDAAALADIAADQGGVFSLGGVDSGEVGPAPNADFSGTGFGDLSHLVLTTGQAPDGTPEPGALALVLGVGTAAFALRRRARK